MAEPGTFRTQEYQNPTSAALSPTVSGGSGGGIGGGIAASAPAAAKEYYDHAEFNYLQSDDEKDKRSDNKKRDATQTLLDTFRAKSSAGKVTGILPVNVTFPAFGPSIYLVSELTSENQFPAAEFSIQREKRGGAR
jgi:hypothetical protein